MTELLLYTRVGCCLCEGLAERLEALALPVPLHRVDIDADAQLRARYDLLVPVLAVSEAAVSLPAVAHGNGAEAGPPEQPRWRELPRVPPRLTGDGLRAWLQRQGVL